MQQQQTQNTIQDTIMGLNPLTSDKPMPSNNQIMSSFTRLREVLQRQRLTNPNLDTKGQEIAEAVERFLETSEAFIHEKNPDEAIQKFLQKVSNFIEKSKKEAQARKAETVGATSTTSSPNLSQVATHLRQLVQQTFTSTQTKSLLRHFDNNMQSMMSIEKRMRNENKSLDEIPREERTELVRSQLKLLAEIGNNKSWASVRQDIMSLYDYFVSKKDTVSQPLAHEFSLLVDDAIELFSRFANRNVFKLKQMLVDTYELLKQDPEARTFFKEFREWGDKVVKNPESASNEDIVRKGEENLDRGLKVYSQHSDRLYAVNEEIRELIHALQNEELLTSFRENIKDVGKSLKGSTLSSIIQLRELMGPVIKESLKDFKLPRISDSDSSSNWSVDNIILHESDLDDVILDIRIGLKDVLEVVLKIKKVEIALKDMNFMYERTSLPQFKDQGKMDVKVYTPTWKMRWVVNQQTGREPFFELADVKGRIKDLDITISEAKHTTIDNLLLKMWSSTLKKRVQTSIEETLTKRSTPITTSLNKFLGNSEAVSLSKTNFDSKMKQQTGTGSEVKQQTGTGTGSEMKQQTRTGTGSETKQVHEKTY